MGAIPTVYRWDDVAAPARPASNGGVDKSGYIGDVLKACLCDGYTGKAAAGWTLHDHVAPVGGTDGRIVLGNASGSGAAKVGLNAAYGFLGPHSIGDGWNSQSGELTGEVPKSVPYQRPVDDVRSLRWSVIANGRAAVLLLWRDPTGLSGTGLSEYNSVALFLGEAVPMVDTMGVGVAPNFFIGAAERPYSDRYDYAGAVCRWRPDGSLDTTGNSVVLGYPVSPAYGGIVSVPVVPLMLSSGGNFARVPGVMHAIANLDEGVQVSFRDEGGVWTGDPVPGLPDAILLTKGRGGGYVSLRTEDWP